jgi:hypothetical protein
MRQHYLTRILCLRNRNHSQEVKLLMSKEQDALELAKTVEQNAVRRIKQTEDNCQNLLESMCT